MVKRNLLSQILILCCILCCSLVATEQEHRKALLLSYQDDAILSVAQLQSLIASLDLREIKSAFLFSTPIPSLQPDLRAVYERAIDSGHSVGLALNCSTSTLLSDPTEKLLAFIEPYLDQLDALFHQSREAQYHYVYFPCPVSLSASARLALKAKRILPILNETVQEVRSFHENTTSDEACSTLLAKTNDATVPGLVQFLDSASKDHRVHFVSIEDLLLREATNAADDTMIWNAASTSTVPGPVANSACGCHQKNDVEIVSVSNVGWLLSALCMFCLLI